jgi:hypothetical protein
MFNAWLAGLGVLFVNMDHFMRHRRNKKRRMTDTARGNSNQMLPVLENVPAIARPVGRYFKNNVVAIGQIPFIEWRRFVQEIIAGPKYVLR